MARHPDKPGIKISASPAQRNKRVYRARSSGRSGAEINPTKRKVVTSMKYVYPAIFPDLPGCITCGNDLADAIEMAEDAVAMWLCEAEDNQESIPSPSEKLDVKAPKFVNLIVADTKKYRYENDNPLFLSYHSQRERRLIHTLEPTRVRPFFLNSPTGDNFSVLIPFSRLPLRTVFRIK